MDKKPYKLDVSIAAEVTDTFQEKMGSFWQYIKNQRKKIKDEESPEAMEVVPKLEASATLKLGSF